MHDERHKGSAEAPPEPVRKLPYEAPRILVREPIEAFAGVCAPSPPAKASVIACPLGPIGS